MRNTPWRTFGSQINEWFMLSQNVLSRCFSFSLTVSEHHMWETQQPGNCCCPRHSSARQGTPTGSQSVSLPALSSDSKRFLFTLKCKPGRHFPAIQVLSSVVPKQVSDLPLTTADSFHCCVTNQWWIKTIWFWLLSCSLLRMGKTCSSSLLNVSSQKYLHIHSVCSLCVCSLFEVAQYSCI